MDYLLGCGAGPLSPRRARATSEQIVSQASASAGAFVVGEAGSGSQEDHSRDPRHSHARAVNFSS